MRFVSTGPTKQLISSSEAILGSVAPDGGLYFPETLPTPVIIAMLFFLLFILIVQKLPI